MNRVISLLPEGLPRWMQGNWFRLYCNDQKPELGGADEIRFFSIHETKYYFDKNRPVVRAALSHIVVMLEKTPVILEMDSHVVDGVNFSKPMLLSERLPISPLAESFLKSAASIKLQTVFTDARRPDYLEWFYSAVTMVAASSDNIVEPGSHIEVAGAGVKFWYGNKVI